MVVGGTFDPVHIGHLHIARVAAEVLGVERAVLAVGDAHPHREPTLFDRGERIAMVRAAIDGEPSLVEAGQLGVNDASLVSVVRRLARRRELHVVFGADSAVRLTGWDGLTELCRVASVWAVPRAGTPAAGLPVPTLPVEPILASASEIRRHAAVHLVPEAVRQTVADALARRAALAS